MTVDVTVSAAATASEGAGTRTRGRAPMHIVLIASEATPWAKTGGLGDVLGALPAALEAKGHRVTLVLPRYRHVNVSDGTAAPHRIRLGDSEHDVQLITLVASEQRRVVLVDYPPFFDRAGLYGAGGEEYADNARRFGLLAVAALDVAEHAKHAPDIIHAHDWQAGLAPAFLRTSPARWPRTAESVGIVFTIHNLAYQGRFPRTVIPELGLDWSVFTTPGAEFWNDVSFLKAGINYSDWVTTVSPTYAQETRTEEFGCGMEGVLRARRDRYVGVLNGIDADVWNPATDPLLPERYDADHLDGKRACKRVLLESFALPVGDDAMARPLVGIVSRLVDQKGFDLIASAADALLALDATWVVVGTGDAKYEEMWRAIQARYPSRVGVFIGFDETRAHLVESGADLFLMPSRFEPCGLNQMYSLRYGTVPVVRAVGGLDDTVRDYTPRARHANGFKFREASGDELLRTVRHAIGVYHTTPVWRALMCEGMSEDHSWNQASREYVKVYRRARRDARVRAAAPLPLS